MIVYRATNTVNGKRYIGVTSQSLATRWRQHVKAAKLPKPAFHRAIAKYGAGAFHVEVIACAKTYEDLLALEVIAIDAERTHVRHGGYNETLGGEGALGLQVSIEARAKMSAFHKARLADPTLRAAMSARMTGTKQSAETLAKKSTSGTGKRHDERTKLILSEIAKQRRRGPHSEETRRKMSEAARSHVRTPEHSAALLSARRMRVMPPHSEETKAKISIAMKAAHARKANPNHKGL